MYKPGDWCNSEYKWEKKSLRREIRELQAIKLARTSTQSLTERERKATIVGWFNSLEKKTVVTTSKILFMNFLTIWQRTYLHFIVEIAIIDWYILHIKHSFTSGRAINKPYTIHIIVELRNLHLKSTIPTPIINWNISPWRFRISGFFQFLIMLMVITLKFVAISRRILSLCNALG